MDSRVGGENAEQTKHGDTQDDVPIVGENEFRELLAEKGIDLE